MFRSKPYLSTHAVEWLSFSTKFFADIDDDELLLKLKLHKEQVSVGWPPRGEWLERFGLVSGLCLWYIQSMLELLRSLRVYLVTASPCSSPHPHARPMLVLTSPSSSHARSHIPMLVPTSPMLVPYARWITRTHAHAPSWTNGCCSSLLPLEWGPCWKRRVVTGCGGRWRSSPSTTTGLIRSLWCGVWGYGVCVCVCECICLQE